MWKQQSSSAPATSSPVQSRPGNPAFEPAGLPADPSARARQPGDEQSIFTNGITVRGEISGPGPIYVDGVVEGQIYIPGERVTVGPNGMVASTSKAPCITAREVVVLGAVRGNIVVTDRLEVRANGSVTGDVSTVRLKIEDGSFFHGAIEIREAEAALSLDAQEEPEQLETSSENYAGATF
jgi:cytoskeletal protein CcmA (bactofilin family)